MSNFYKSIKESVGQIHLLVAQILYSQVFGIHFLTNFWETNDIKKIEWALGHLHEYAIWGSENEGYAILLQKLKIFHKYSVTYDHGMLPITA